jgi:hypothetical protein
MAIINFKLPSERYLADGLFAISDRRASARFRTVCFDVTVEREGHVRLFRARNISDKGMMLNTHEPVEVGEQVMIGLSERLAIQGTILWCNERCCGVQFDRPINCKALLKAGTEHKREDRRCSTRVAATRLATTYAENGIRAVRVTNVSRRGMGLAHDGTLGADMLLKLIVESGVEREARVRWSQGGLAGVRLLEPLSCEELASVSGSVDRVDRVANIAVPELALAD